MRSAEPSAGLPALDGLPGLEDVHSQLAGVLAVLRAEQARARSGAAVTRRVQPNLVFAGGPGSGKSRAASALAGAYRDLGLLSSGHLAEAVIADLIGDHPRTTTYLVRDAVARGLRGVLMITGAGQSGALGQGERQVLRALLDALDDHPGNIAVILAGEDEPMRQLVAGLPVLASRFPAVIKFPGYAPHQLGAIFGTLATEAGFALTPEAARKAAAVLTIAAEQASECSARLAVALLNHAIATQAARLAGAPDGEQCRMDASDVPVQVALPSPVRGGSPGQYL